MVIDSLEGWKFVKVTFQASGSDFKFKMDFKDSTTSVNVFDLTISGVSFTGNKSIYINSDTNGSTGASMYVNEVWWYNTISVSSEFDSLYATTSTRQASTCVSSPSVPCMGDSLYTDKNSDDEYCTGACSICYSNPSNCIVCRNDCLLGCYDFLIPKCILCPTTCSSCDIDTLKCICDASASLSGNSCICPSGYEQSSSNPVKCIPIVCNEKCTCSSNSNPCTGCVSNASPVASACECNTNYVEDPSNSNACVLRAVCQDDEYVDTANTCQPCPGGCETCSLDENDDIVCGDCEDTYYLDTDQICKVCPDDCILCALNGSNSLVCEECNSNFYIQPAGSPTLCAYTCPVSYYTDESANWSCEPCTSNCKTCTNSHDCEECNSNFYIQPAGSPTLCANTCPDSYYTDQSDSWSCEPCTSNCKTCANSHDCEECNSNFYIQPAGSPTLCANTCPDSYYTDESDNWSCQNCISDCKTCTNSQDCEECISNLYIQPVGSPTLCANTCPDSYYTDESANWNCEPCTSNCKTCTNSQDCEECMSSYYRLASEERAACYSTCPDGFYPEGSECIPCYMENCTLCRSNTECIICDSSYYLSSFTLACLPCIDNCDICTSSSNCIQCSSSYYIDSSEGDIVCKLDCPENCIGCNINTRCNICDDGYYILSQENYDTCEKGCPEGYYESKLDAWKCMECTYGCRSCLSSSICTSCIEEYILEGDSCVCSEGYYMESTTRICRACPMYCITCKVSQRSETCSLCEDGYYILKQENYDMCVRVCPEGYYESRSDGWKCIECPYECRSCLSSSVCTSCIEEYILEGDSCVCSPGYYMESASRICKPCPNLCKTCLKSQSSFECTSCVDFSYLSSSNFCECYSEPSQSSSECPKSCPESMQINSSSTNCISKPSQSTNSQQEIQQADNVEQANTVLAYANFAAFTLSQFSSNANIWIMINTIQIFSFMPLLQVDMPLFLDSGLKAQRDYYLSYDLFSEFYHSDIKPFEKAYDFKYKNSNFILNIGKPVFLLLIIIAVHLICFIGASHCKVKMKGYLDRMHGWFYYKVYLIYFIEMYLEILVPAFIQCIYV